MEFGGKPNEENLTLTVVHLFPRNTYAFILYICKHIQTELNLWEMLLRPENVEISIEKSAYLIVISSISLAVASSPRSNCDGPLIEVDID